MSDPGQYITLVGQMASQVIQGTSLTNAAIGQGAQYAASLPVYRVNRARGAAVADLGYQALDVWSKWRPWVFAASCVGFVSSLGAITYRRKVPEAWPVYGAAVVASGAVAWFTRPDAFRAPPAPPPADVSAKPSDSMQRLLGWIDSKVENNSTTRPGWESATLNRLANDLGMGTLVAQPNVQVLLSGNSL